MKPRRVQVSYNKEGFFLTVEEYSRFYSLAAKVADKICGLLGHWFCNSFFAYFDDKDWKSSKDLVKIPINRAQADALAYSEDSWTWLDD